MLQNPMQYPLLQQPSTYIATSHGPQKTRWQRWDRRVMRIWSLTPYNKKSSHQKYPGRRIAPALMLGNQVTKHLDFHHAFYIWIYMVYWFVDTRPIFQKSWKSVGVLLVFDRSLFMIWIFSKEFCQVSLCLEQLKDGGDLALYSVPLRNETEETDPGRGGNTTRISGKTIPVISGTNLGWV